MQIARTDNVKPQNKVGLPICESDLMFLNIIRSSRRGEGGLEFLKKNNNDNPLKNEIKSVNSFLFFF